MILIWKKKQKIFSILSRDVEDVDLFVGLNLEDPLPGALIGPVSACLLGPQFKALRDGDRFFFSHSSALPSSMINWSLVFSL